MIAQVVVLKRLPKHIGVFDYTIPDFLGEKVQLGQLVRVPFRRGIAFGIIMNLAATSDFSTLKPLDDIVIDTPLFGMTDLAYIKRAAAFYGVYPGIIASMMAPPLQKRKLTKVTLPPVQDQSGKVPPSYQQYTTPNEQQTLIKTLTTKGQTLILVPEKKHIPNIVALLSDKRVGVWHSDVSQKDMFATWVGCRTGDIDVVVGTRSAAFLPFLNLSTVVVDQEYHKEHKQIEQAPRFDVRDVIHMRFRYAGVSCVFMGHTPSIEGYYALFNGQWLLEDTSIKQFPPQTLATLPQPQPVVIDMNNERVGHNFSFLSFQAEQALLQASKHVLIYINRTYDASAYQTDEQPYLAATTSSVYDFIRAHQDLCPHHQVIQYTTEADINPDKPQIIIASQGAIPHLPWDNIELVICISLDPELSYPEATATADLWYRHHDMKYRSTADTRWYIQTKDPDHLFFRSLVEPDRWYRTELQSRKALHYAPYGYVLRCLYASKDVREVQIQTTQLYQQLATDLTITSQCHTMSRPYPLDPPVHRGQHVAAIRLLVKTDQWESVVSYVGQMLPAGWQLDPRPTSTFSY